MSLKSGSEMVGSCQPALDWLPILDRVGAAVMVANAEQRIVRVNRAFSAMTGYAAEEVVGKTPRLLASGRHDGDFYQRMWNTIRQRGAWEGEIWNRRRNGEIYPEWLLINALHDDTGVLEGYVATFSDISQLKRAESEIQHLAFYDSLTGLPNRRLLLDRLEKARALGQRNGYSGALLFIDLDHFKNLNDTLGHAIGDHLLIEVAQRLRRCIRECDTAARQGGDEFVVMLEALDADPQQAAVAAEAIAEKICAALAEPVLLVDQHEHFCTASIGISLFGGTEKSAESLLKQADIALYKAKEAGRNTVRYFDQAMQTALDERAQLEVGLRYALAKGEFVLHVQPQVTADKRLVGAETLIRWYRADGSIVGPDRFIPLAEENGLIVPIGLWVLDSACAQLRRWGGDPALNGLCLAVNVSARQFRQPDFVEQVRNALARHQVDPSRLKLELTESLLLDKKDEVVDKMNALKALGIRFSLDDFGTGYASLAYLKRFPFEQLKIDRSFINHITHNADDASIVRAILAMGDSLRLQVVAEGVEQTEQHGYLVRHGCCLFQGYLFGRPVTFAEFEAAIANADLLLPGA